MSINEIDLFSLKRPFQTEIKTIIFERFAYNLQVFYNLFKYLLHKVVFFM